MTYFLTIKPFRDVHGHTHGELVQIEADSPEDLAKVFGAWLTANPDVRPAREMVLQQQ